VRCLSTVHVYAQDVPQFLHDCPRRFIDHCIRRLPPSVDIIKPTQITALSGDTFDIQSKEQVYRIDLSGSIPTCQCIDFSHWFMPCKHMLAVVQHFGWQCLPEQYRNFPIFVLDSDVADVPAYSRTDRHYSASEPITDQLPDDSVSLAAGEQIDDSAVPLSVNKDLYIICPMLCYSNETDDNPWYKPALCLHLAKSGNDNVQGKSTRNWTYMAENYFCYLLI